MTTERIKSTGSNTQVSESNVSNHYLQGKQPVLTFAPNVSNHYLHSDSQTNSGTAPRPGIYGDIEIRASKRGRWYAVRHLPDGGFDYLAQNVSHDDLAQADNDRCRTPGCTVPAWHRNLCGMHLAADAVAYAKSIK